MNKVGIYCLSYHDDIDYSSVSDSDFQMKEIHFDNSWYKLVRKHFCIGNYINYKILHSQH